MQSRRGKEAFVQFRLSAGSGPLDCSTVFWVLDVWETEVSPGPPWYLVDGSPWKC